MRSRSEVADYSWEYDRAVCIFKDGTSMEYECDKYDLCDIIGKEIMTDVGGDWVADEYDLSYDSDGWIATNMVDINHYTPYRKELETLFSNLKMIQ